MRLTLDRDQVAGLVEATTRGEAIEIEMEDRVLFRLLPISQEDDEGPYEAGLAGYDSEDETLIRHLNRPKVQAYFTGLRAQMEAGDKLSHEQVWGEVLGAEE